MPGQSALRAQAPQTLTPGITAARRRSAPSPQIANLNSQRLRPGRPLLIRRFPFSFNAFKPASCQCRVPARGARRRRRNQVSDLSPSGQGAAFGRNRRVPAGADGNLKSLCRHTPRKAFKPSPAGASSNPISNYRRMPPTAGSSNLRRKVPATSFRTPSPTRPSGIFTPRRLGTCYVAPRQAKAGWHPAGYAPKGAEKERR